MSIVRGERLGISLEGLTDATSLAYRSDHHWRENARWKFRYDHSHSSKLLLRQSRHPFGLILIIGGAYFLLKDYD